MLIKSPITIIRIRVHIRIPTMANIHTRIRHTQHIHLMGFINPIKAVPMLIDHLLWNGFFCETMEM